MATPSSPNLAINEHRHGRRHPLDPVLSSIRASTHLKQPAITVGSPTQIQQRWPIRDPNHPSVPNSVQIGHAQQIWQAHPVKSGQHSRFVASRSSGHNRLHPQSDLSGVPSASNGPSN
ncbi:hypothetical protein ACLOJK_004493 [Asimina triloba]